MAENKTKTTDASEERLSPACRADEEAGRASHGKSCLYINELDDVPEGRP